MTYYMGRKDFCPRCGKSPVKLVRGLHGEMICEECYAKQKRRVEKVIE